MNIKVQNLRFAYGAKSVLDISSTEFEQGKIYGIVGKNGVGKTTFFKVLTNIIISYSGSVLLDGVDIKQNLKALSRVGIVLDDMELYKNQSGMFNIRYFGGLRGGVDEARALQLAQELEIADSLHRKVNTYSLGMNKKLILLISIMNDAEVLIFDEPFRGLDAKSVNWFKKHLLNLKKQGRMILISSHVKEDIESLSDQVMVMDNGDFRYSFDLNIGEQEYIYSVDVNNKPVLMDILRANGISFEEQDLFVKIEMNESKYKEIFKQAVEQDIEFYQIKRESKFVDLLK